MSELNQQMPVPMIEIHRHWQDWREPSSIKVPVSVFIRDYAKSVFDFDLIVKDSEETETGELTIMVGEDENMMITLNLETGRFSLLEYRESGGDRLNTARS